MKKIGLLLTICILGSLLFMLPAHASSDTKDGVVRNILNQIVWNPEYQRIEIHKTIVQKYKNQITAAYPVVDVIYGAIDKKNPTQDESISENMNTTRYTNRISFLGTR